MYTLCVIDQCVIDMYKTITKKLKAWWPSKIITLLIQKKKKKIKFKSNQNTKYDIISMQLTNWYGGDALKQELHQTHCVLTS